MYILNKILLKLKEVLSSKLSLVQHMQTGRLYVMLPLPSLIANLTNLTEVLVWLNEVLVRLAEVAILANLSMSLQVCSLHL